MGSERCIRDRASALRDEFAEADRREVHRHRQRIVDVVGEQVERCLLYTSDAADERSSVDLGGRRIIKKKNHINHSDGHVATRKDITHEATL